MLHGMGLFVPAYTVRGVEGIWVSPAGIRPPYVALLSNRGEPR